MTTLQSNSTLLERSYKENAGEETSLQQQKKCNLDEQSVVQDCNPVEIICSRVGNVIPQTFTSVVLNDEYNKCEAQQIHQQASTSNAESYKKEMSKRFRSRKRSLEFSVVSRAEHKRWRQDIDGFAQYCEWEAKVNQPCNDDMSDFESTESVSSYDPAKEYYFKVTIPFSNDDELAEIYDFVDKMNRKIDEEERKEVKVNANLKGKK